MAMNLRLSDELERAVADRAVRKGKSKHKVIEEAVAAWTSQRIERLHVHFAVIAAEDASLLERLGE